MSDNLKVLNVYRTYFPDPPGGLQEAIRQICISTQSLGIDNTVFTLSPRPNPEMIRLPEASVVRCRSWAAPASCDLGGPKAFVRFRALAEQADVIHYLFPWPFADVLHNIVAPKKPAVLTYISDIVRQRWLGAVYAPLMWRTLRSMSVIVSNAPKYANTSPVLTDVTLLPKLRQIPLGIEELSYPSDGDDTVLERLGLLDGEPFVLFIGVLRYYKGLHTLLEASAMVRGRIVITGSGPEGSVLQAQARNRNLRNVLFAGQVTNNEKVALLKACRTLVLPSHLRAEAYGMVLVEASMFGKPMVSCEIGTGTSFVNKHEETGFVVQPEDSIALAQAINKLLTDDDLAQEFGNAARRRYEALFSGPAMGKAYSDLYREVISR